MLSKPTCPACGNPSMYPLARYFEEDVNENPTVDTYVPSRALGWAAPGTAVTIMIGSWFINLFFGKAKVAKNRAKVRAARENVLPRAPNSLICPSCFEVLERF